MISRIPEYDSTPLAVAVRTGQVTVLPDYVLNAHDGQISLFKAIIRKSKGPPHDGIAFMADLPDQSDTYGRFSALTDVDGYVELVIPAAAGIWRLSTSYEDWASIWQVVRHPPSGRIELNLGHYEIGPRKRVNITWRKNPVIGSTLFGGRSLVGGIAEFDGFARERRSFNFQTLKYSDGDCEGSEKADLSIIQAGDSHRMWRMKNVYTTESIELAPGPFACGPLGQSGIADLGLRDLDSVYVVDDVITRDSARDSVKATPGHVYALRTYDGSNYVLLRVDSVQDIE